MSEHAYFVMTVGECAGTSFTLDPAVETTIGRDSECHVVLADPLCSRVHAVIARRENAWYVRDADSRNGTFLAGQKISDALLAEGHVVRVGSTELTFHVTDQPPTSPSEPGSGVMHTIVMETPVALRDSKHISLDGTPDPEQARELVLLFQLTIRLLGCHEPDDVVREALGLLHERTRAAVVGFLWVNDEGKLQPKQVIPADAAGQVTLSESLTELVSRQKHAVWIANQALNNQPGKASQSLKHYADAVCAPLVHDGATLGAIHVYLDRGRFRQSDFDFTISVANIVAVALVRAREHTSLAESFRQLMKKSPGYSEMVGESDKMVALRSKIQRVARATGCVLIRGESGAGKELVARAIHRESTRADRPLLTVNCAAIPRDLMESQLFGHKAGAFTGADRDHPGFFRQADLGTLFLDEVGELTLEGQAKLLRILEGHPFLPVGATAEIKVDVRVIAATNQNLLNFVREKKFREDLFYRLSVFELYVPALRERGEDIGRLLDFFLEHFRQQHGRPQLGISASARQKLLGYHWPGNVRQLRNVIDSAVVLADGPSIESGDLGLFDSGTGELETLQLDHWERKLIGEALRRTGGNVPEAALLLGIGRATLYRKIEQYGISR